MREPRKNPNRYDYEKDGKNMTTRKMIDFFVNPPPIERVRKTMSKSIKEQKTNKFEKRLRL